MGGNDLERDRGRGGMAARILLLLALTHVAAVRLSWNDIPLQNDTGLFSYIGWRMLHGDRLYVDLWECKPPGIYFVFAGCVAMDRAGGDRVAFWLDGALSAAVLLLTYRLARRFASPAASAAATLAASIVFCHRVLADWGDNVEKFVALFDVLALMLLMHGESRGGRSAEWFAAGVCAGLGGLFKQTAVFFPAAAVLWLIAGVVGRRLTRNAALRRAALLFTGALAPWLVFIMWMWADGLLAAFFWQTIAYEWRRVASTQLEAPQLLTPTHWRHAWSQIELAGILLLPAAAGAAVQAARAVRRFGTTAAETREITSLIHVLWIIGVAGFALTPFGYGHYLLQAVPAAAVAAAMGLTWVAVLWSDRKTAPNTQQEAGRVSGMHGVFVRRVAVMACGAAWMASWLPLRDQLSFTFNPDAPARLAYAWQRLRTDALLAAIDAHTRPQDAVLLWPTDYGLNYYAQRVSPFHVANADVIFKGKFYRLDPPLAELLEHLKKDPPAVLADRSVWLEPDPHDPTGVAPRVATPDDGMSLLSPPNAAHANPVTRELAPLLEWVRAHYGRPVFAGGAVFLHYGGQWSDDVVIK
ncbi:MAG: glycosyltransferase family 39 protein [Phycisphaerae bacterium]|nr:glycosyltransferase family 39 protein [Phycisphaerae bacterium]NUQ44899.1 glycosyltransferase family 39 protein [Phycisphaerae bacterium]